ncbi:hypothetical protein GIB67_012256 [Kingdonia uniflora]|uniref:DUF4283 domain-containing protein n=1 Tax=Kingdonia uniflora TaxID=39325 RepID=A0A7J7M940_9MAGN|nr:hypothetical protein GIB67_012256 [Kingdonia uniflora]
MGVSRFQFSFIGHLDLLKVKFEVVQEYARTQWKLSRYCKIVPLGKGFFIIKLDNESGKIHIWDQGPWMVEKIPMRLVPWSPLFLVDNHHNTNALIWCKFPGLPSELWSQKIVMSLGKTLGSPIHLDRSAINHDYGYQASVLVDMIFQSLFLIMFLSTLRFGDIGLTNKYHALSDGESIKQDTSAQRVSRNEVDKDDQGDTNVGYSEVCHIESVMLGVTFTWYNGQNGLMRILSVLDRSLINDNWNDKFRTWKTGDPSKRKGITLRWEKLCKPLKEGGLGIRSLREVNNAMLCKLNYIFSQREETWAQLLHAKFHTTSGDNIQYHKRSFVWQGVKHADGITKPFIGWIIGKGIKIDLWRDAWASDIPLREHIDLPHHLWKKCTARVSDFINVDGWNFPPDTSLAFLAMRIDMTNIPYNPSVEDIQISDLETIFSW